jgi:hypothetical protein
MLLKAQFQDCPEKGLLRGQFFSSVRSLSAELGMTRDGMHRFLSRCEAEGDILWERGTGQTQSQTQCQTHESRFTIVKFDTYQTQCQTQCQTPSLQKKKKEYISVSKETVIKKQTRATKDQEELKKLLSAIDRKAVADKFPLLDVRAEWSKFQRYVLEGTPKKPTPNPGNWLNFQMAFRNWCDSANHRSTGEDNHATARPSEKWLTD